MALPHDLVNALMENNGIVTTAQANAIGVSNERLRLLVRDGELDRVAHGVYISPDEFADMIYIEQLRRPRMIYSHETALFLQGLTDRDPIDYSVTVPAGYNAKSLREEGFTVYTVKRSLHEVGIIKHQTMFGHMVITYNMERTICDCLRSRNQMDIAVVTDAIKQYASRPNKNLNELMKMAELFRVSKPLRSYLEVLL